MASFPPSPRKEEAEEVKWDDVFFVPPVKTRRGRRRRRRTEGQKGAIPLSGVKLHREDLKVWDFSRVHGTAPISSLDRSHSLATMSRLIKSDYTDPGGRILLRQFGREESPPLPLSPSARRNGKDVDRDVLPLSLLRFYDAIREILRRIEPSLDYSSSKTCLCVDASQHENTDATHTSMPYTMYYVVNPY